VSETAPIQDVRVTTALGEPGRPSLVVVPAPPPDGATDREPNPGRWGLIGYAIGFVVACAGITIAGTIGGMGAGASFGLGAFVGVWGGGGFGFMLGATIPLARHLDAQHNRSRIQGDTS
jgi:hypothetical protein